MYEGMKLHTLFIDAKSIESLLEDLEYLYNCEINGFYGYGDKYITTERLIRRIKELKSQGVVDLEDIYKQIYYEM